MRSILVFAIVVISAFSALAQQQPAISIIPRPSEIKPGTGHFQFDQKTKIVAKTKSGRVIAGMLNDRLLARYGFKLEYASKNQPSNYIEISEITPPKIVDNERYIISIKPDGIKITGTEASNFYALQSLMQLIPADYNGPVNIPAAEIIDKPSFKYRGMHLDIARHFQPVSYVKRYIDLMSQYKFNYFHWHLTDDQGWRIEIKKYPKLTEIGSTRPESHEGRYSPIFKGDGRPVSGFYTQKEIKEVIAYAKERNITVIPEIELPGHASAALAAYPQLSCKPDQKYEVQKTWGIFKEVFCPTDETFKFLEDVLDETIKLFHDSPYIHIGGDEVLKDHWKESAFVQELKKRENLKDEHEVQSYFVRRIEKFINSKGKKIIGWDEILEGGLAPNATVMSWRGTTGGIAAAKSRHDVIMTPNTFLYLDYGQGDPAYEPLNIGGYLPLSTVYSFHPVPEELTAEEAKYVIGGQANLWTEYIETPQQIEYMIFPRMLALSEAVWSGLENKNFENFKIRLADRFADLDQQGVNYRIPEPAGLENIVTEKAETFLELRPMRGTRVHYTTDGTDPDERSPVYDNPIVLSLKPDEIKTVKTIVVNAKGRRSSIYTATVARGKMKAPETVKTTGEGLKYELVVPGDQSRSRSGVTKTLAFSEFEKTIDITKPFSVQYDGYIKIPADGVYELQSDATWDTTIVLGNKMVIDDAGTADRKPRSAIVPLKAGLHKISLRYNNRGGAPYFRFRYGIKGQGLKQAWGGEFVY